MGIREVAVLIAAQQLSQALGAYLASISPLPKNPWLAALIPVGVQLASNAANAFGAGASAAASELQTTQGAESAVVLTLQALPPIT